MRIPSCFRFRPLLATALLVAPALAQAQTGVGIGTPTPDASAALDVRSTTAGMLVPRLTQAQRLAIAGPATGLLVFQTDGGTQAGFWFNAGTPAAPAWTFINPSGGGGDNLGNHTATQNLNLRANALVGTGASIIGVGLGVRADGGLNLGQNAPFNNVLLGYQAGRALTPIRDDLGSQNQFIGYQSGFNTRTGFRNQFSGFQSGYSNGLSVANQFSGYQSGYGNTTGNSNTFSGYQSGYRSVTGSFNTALGSSSGPTTGNLSNTLVLGAGASVNTSNTVQLGNAGITLLRCSAPLTVLSDARFKYDVRADVPGLAFITRLRPVTYRFDAARLSAFTRTGKLAARSAPNPKAVVQTGFLAQEVEATVKSLGFAFSGVHAPANARDPYGLAYSQFVVPLVRAVQEQQAQIEQLKTQNAALQTSTSAATAALLRRVQVLEAQAPRASR